MFDGFQHPSTFRRLLVFDGVTSGATGVLLALAPDRLGAAMQLPVPLLRYAGLSLLPFAAFLLWLARAQSPDRAGMWAVITLNLSWCAASILLPMTGLVAPNALGYAFVLGQALVVGLLAELQIVALRSSALSPERRA